MFTLFSLSGKLLIKYLVKRILFSKLLAKKNLFLETLFSLQIVEKPDIIGF